MRAERLLAGMTLREKVGQLLLAGFEGTEPSREIERLMTEYHFGAVILYARNFANKRISQWGTAGAELTHEDVKSARQVAELTNQLQALAQRTRLSVPLFVWGDFECGAVTTFPANMGLGVIGSEEVCRRFGQIVGEESRALGVHLVSAPVVDVNNNPENPVIGVRSFGEEPGLVSRLGVATLRGIQSAGAIAMAKHFPGHGDTAVDSHLGVPMVAHPVERLQSVELPPFRAAVAAGVKSLCTAHALYPALDDTPNTVATVSPKIISHLLRTEMGYAGLVFSDCLTMQGIAQTVGTARGAVEFIKAGGDVAIVCHTFDAPVEAFETVLKAAQLGEISEERINQSVLRVLRAKEKLGLLDCPFVDVDVVTDVVGTKDKIAFARQVAANAVTVIKDEANLLPLRLPADARLLLLCPPEAEPLAQIVCENHANTVVVSPADSSRMASELQRSHTFIAVYWRRCPSWSKVPEGEEKLSQYFRQHPRSLLISLVSPYESRRFAHVSTAVTAFSAKETSQKAAAAFLFGM